MRVFGGTVGLSRLVAISAAALGVLGLAAPAASAAPASSSAAVGWIRMAHLSTNTPAVDVYLYSFGNSNARVVLHHVAYGDVSPYEKVAAGEYTVAMRAAGAPGASKPVLSTSIDVAPGGAYTVAGVGPEAGLRLQVLTDQLTTPKGKALVRVIQASMHQEKVTVRLNGTDLANEIAFSHVSSYTAVPPGLLSVHVTGPSESTTRTVKLTPGSIHTLVVLDGASSLAVDDLIDAQGSKVVPNGGVRTGLGGTAARPGAALLPWGSAAAVGLLLAAGGALFASRRRRPALHAR